jgi:hypothetical protein
METKDTAWLSCVDEISTVLSDGSSEAMKLAHSTASKKRAHRIMEAIERHRQAKGSEQEHELHLQLLRACSDALRFLPREQRETPMYRKAVKSLIAMEYLLKALKAFKDFGEVYDEYRSEFPPHPKEDTDAPDVV